VETLEATSAPPERVDVFIVPMGGPPPTEAQKAAAVAAHERAYPDRLIRVIRLDRPPGVDR
jgi:hypothetical protein